MSEFLKLAADLGGFAGLVCVWIVWFIGSRLEKLEAAFYHLRDSWDRHTKMELMRLIVSPHVSQGVKTQLESQLRDVESVETL